MAKVFLGGTCNESKWRDKLIPMLKIDYFNPVVDDWNEDAYKEELRQKEICDYCLYTITPRMLGVYSIAEVVDDSNKRPEKTIFCLLENEFPDGYETNLQGEKFPYWNCPDKFKHFNKGQMKSLDRVGLMVERNGGKYFKSLEEVANYLNREENKRC